MADKKPPQLIPAVTGLTTGFGNFRENFQISISSTFSANNVKFLAYLNSFTDSHKTNFKSQTVYGRMDPIVNYQNTTRIINISFTVPSESEDAAKTNLGKISDLIKFQYPYYENLEDASGLASPPICTMRFKNLIQEYSVGLNGFFNGVDFTPINESGYFLDKAGLYPKEFKVNLSFTVLHNRPTGWNSQTENWGIEGQYPYNVGLKGKEVVLSNSSADAADQPPDANPAGSP